MITYPLSKEGFIQNWLTTGKNDVLFTAPDFNKEFGDQIEYEQTLRTLMYNPTKTPPAEKAVFGNASALGNAWHYYYNHGNTFIDYSRFYSLLSKIETDVQCYITSETEQTVDAILWTYETAEVWLNGELVAENQVPVYKPIRQIKFKMPLKAGDNWLYVRCVNLGVRDTRNIMGIQILNGNNVKVALEKDARTIFATEATNWLQSLYCKGSVLYTQNACKHKCTIKTAEQTFAFEGDKLDLGDKIQKFDVTVSDGADSYTRAFELLCNTKPHYYPAQQENSLENICKDIASAPYVMHGPGNHVSSFNVLARLYYDMQTPKDDEYLMGDFDLIEKRIDCSDFMFVALLRMQKLYPLSDAVKARMKEVFLNFRYWMDEKGSDGMCFWSENHALMFYSSMAMAGELYKDELFTRSNRLGSEQAAIGYARCEAWLDSVEEEGLEEFNSATYMLVTIAALLNLVDFAPASLGERASKIMDLILRQFAKHIFDESIISPQGRVYRDVFIPHMQSAQSLLNLMFAHYPYSGKESMWFALFLTTKYVFPNNLAEIAAKDYDENYTSAYTRIHVKKTANYMLTSSQSPRSAGDLPKWENLCFTENPDKSTNAYVKSLNERFHGTSYFRAGAYGYQQHLWYAALSKECVVFTTNPGSHVDCDEMRPGYWYGNLSLPAVLQNKNELLSIYSIADNIQTKFTHVFWPTFKFDEIIVESNYLFGRYKDGLVALWCSGELVAHNDVLQECEYRCYSQDVAYVCTCSDIQSETNLADFAKRIKANTPVWNAQEKTLKTQNTQLKYIAEYDLSQEL